MIRSLCIIIVFLTLSGYLFYDFKTRESGSYMINSIGVSNEWVTGTVYNLDDSAQLTKFYSMNYEMKNDALLLIPQTTGIVRSLFSNVPIASDSDKLLTDEIILHGDERAGYVFQIKGDFQTIKKIYIKRGDSKEMIWSK